MKEAPDAGPQLMLQLKTCLNNKEFVFTGIGTGGILIYNNVISTIFGQLLVPYGITNDKFVTKMGVYFTGIGIVDGLVFAAILTWLPKFMNKAAYVICIASIVVLGYFYYADIEAD